MNKQQTAVEWLYEQLWNTPKDKLNWWAIKAEAKAMFRQQIEDAYIDGDDNPIDTNSYKELSKADAANYYNEKYGL